MFNKAREAGNKFLHLEECQLGFTHAHTLVHIMICTRDVVVNGQWSMVNEPSRFWSPHSCNCVFVNSVSPTLARIRYLSSAKVLRMPWSSTTAPELHTFDFYRPVICVKICLVFTRQGSEGREESSDTVSIICRFASSVAQEEARQLHRHALWGNDECRHIVVISHWAGPRDVRVNAKFPNDNPTSRSTYIRVCADGTLYAPRGYIRPIAMKIESNDLA